MNVLLVYPKYPDTYWSFKHALKFISKKASSMPLGLITIAALLPAGWNKKLVDLNVSNLKDKDIKWADLVFISAMSVQSASVDLIIRQCKRLNVKIVAGGPLFTEQYDQYSEIDFLVLNEGELTLPRFIEDFSKGEPKKIYQSESFADITLSPVPDYSLIDLKEYTTACIQYSRGCPYDCEFCDITALLGHRVRTKTTKQIIAELDQLYKAGWKESVFFVDDNFIGNKKHIKADLLPAIIDWMNAHGRPFEFLTEASINMADDKELMELMIKAGFNRVFIGVETPDDICLNECNKLHNKNRDLINSVRTIQQYGMEVFGGFIVGFDNDHPGIFQRQIEFIQQSGIITAMVGLLNAPRLSKLYNRLENEGRIVYQFTGDNTDNSINFVPVMDINELMKGYRNILSSIYSARPYADRVIRFLKYYNPPYVKPSFSFNKFMALVKSLIILGIANKNLFYFWKVLTWCIFNRPKLFPLAIKYNIYGYHFRRVFKSYI